MQGYDKLNDGMTDDKLSEIKRYIREWYSYWSINNQYFRQQMTFLEGDQWDSGTANYMALAKIPTITVNICKNVVKQLISEMVQNIPELEVIPKNMYVDQDQIELLQDMNRTAMVNCNGDEQLQNVVKNVMCGQGAIQIGTRYISPDSFQQESYFEFVSEPSMCGWDTTARLPTKSDGDVAFRMHSMNKKQFKREFPGEEFRPSGFEGFNSAQNNMYSSNKRVDTCVVCEFYMKEYKSTKFVKVSPTIDGEPYAEMEEREFNDYLSQYFEMVSQKRLESEMMGDIYMTPPMPQIIERKKDKKYITKCYMVRDDMILKEYDWEGKELPIIYVDGDSWELDGQQHIKSVFHEAQDLQRTLNYQWSFLVQFMKTAMHGKVFATPEQMKGWEHIYNNPELYHGAIPYNWIAAVGAPPQTIDAPQLKQEILMAIQNTTQSIFSLLGRQEAAMGVNPQGMQSQPTSGKAYQLQTMQQNTTHYIQSKNVWNAVKQIGMIFIDLYPKIYPDLQVITIYDKDFQHKQVELNGQDQETGQPMNEMKPIKATINVSPSASFEMQKQMERDYLLQLLQSAAASPQLFGIIADQLASLSETSITPIIVRRLKTLIPPNVLAADDGKEGPPPPEPQPNPEFMLKQQELQLKGQELQQNMEIKQQEHQIELAKLQQSGVEAIIDAHKNNVKTSSELKKAQLSLAATLATTQHKMQSSREQQGHQRYMQEAEQISQRASAQSQR